MSFIEEIKQRAKQDIKTIILPEAQDIRTLKATEQVLKEGYRTIDIMPQAGESTEGIEQVGTAKMGDLIAAAL